MKFKFVFIVTCMLVLNSVYFDVKPVIAADSIKLTVMIHKGPEADILATCIKQYQIDYNKNEMRKQIKIDVQQKPEYGYQDTLVAAVNSETPPDLFEVDGPHVTEMVFRNKLKPLEPYLLDIANPDAPPHFYAPLLDQGTVHGVLYTLPTYNSSVAIYYNKSIVTESMVKNVIGRGFPKSVDDAWTYEQLRDVLIQCLEDKKAEYGLLLDMDINGSADELLTFLYLPIVYSRVNRIMNPETYKFSGYVNHPDAAAALDWFRRNLMYNLQFPHLVYLERQSIENDYVHCRENGKLKYKKRLCDQDCCNRDFDYLEAFKNRKAAMLWHGHWQYNTLHACLEDDLGIMPLPYFKAHKKSSPFGSYSWAMHAKTHYPEEVTALIRFLTSPEIQQKAIEGMTKQEVLEAKKGKYLLIDDDDKRKRINARIDTTGDADILLNSGGALPTCTDAAAMLSIYKIPEGTHLPDIQANPRLVFIRQSGQTADARPKTPAYATFTYKFANMMRMLARYAPDSSTPEKAEVVQDYLDDIATETDRYMKQVILDGRFDSVRSY